MERVPAVPSSEAEIAGSVSSQVEATVLTTAEQRKYSASKLKCFYFEVQPSLPGLANWLTWENWFPLHSCRLMKSAALLQLSVQEVVRQTLWLHHSLQDNCASGSCGLNRLRIFLAIRCRRYFSMCRVHVCVSCCSAETSPQGHFIMFSHTWSRHTKHTLSCFFHQGSSEEGASSLVFLNRSTLGDSITDERVMMLFFLMNFTLVVWRQAHPGYIFKINPTSLVCLGSMGHDSVYYLNIPFIYDFSSCACTYSSWTQNFGYFLHRFSTYRFCIWADFWDISVTICLRKYVQYFFFFFFYEERWEKNTLPLWLFGHWSSSAIITVPLSVLYQADIPWLEQIRWINYQTLLKKRARQMFLF